MEYIQKKIHNNKEVAGMNILVTGGAGFIGRWVVQKLLSDHHKIWVVDDCSNGSEENIKEFIVDTEKKIFFSKGDIKDKSFIQEVFEQPFDLCYHLAASINVQDSIDDPGTTFDNDVVGTMNVLQLCKEHNVKLVFMSTCMVYDRADDAQGITEVHATKPASPYAGSKLSAENMVLSFWYAYEHPVVVVRPFNTYGPFQKSSGEGGVVSVFIQKMLKDEPLCIYGDGKQTRDLLYVEDCAEFLVSCGYNENVNGQIINAGTGYDISINALAGLICKDSSKIQHVTHIHPQSEIMKLQCNASKAREMLDWAPKVSLQEGIEKTRIWIENTTKKEEKQ